MLPFMRPYMMEAEVRADILDLGIEPDNLSPWMRNMVTLWPEEPFSTYRRNYVPHREWRPTVT